MYLRINHSPKGDYLSICEKFRDPKSGVPKDRVVKKSAMLMITNLNTQIPSSTSVSWPNR